MIDTHAHLDFGSFSTDREKVISRFFDEGGKFIVNIGVDKKRNRKSIEIAESDDRIFSTIGFHPEAIEKALPEEAAEFLRGLIKEDKKREKQKIVAVGEIGLDYFHISHLEESKKKEAIQKQKDLFVVQLKVASENNLPVVIHSRDAGGDVFAVVKKWHKKISRVVIHCYSESLGKTEEYLEIPNVYFSFTGNITFIKDKSKKDSEIFRVIRTIPIERIMIETDCPFLAPMPHRGKRNEPVYIRYILEKIAGIKGIKVDEVEKVTDENAINFFNLK